MRATAQVAQRVCVLRSNTWQSRGWGREGGSWCVAALPLHLLAACCAVLTSSPPDHGQDELTPPQEAPLPQPGCHKTPWAGRRRAALAATLGTVRSARRLALSACGRRCGRFLWGQWPSRGARGAATCGAALALLALASSCRRASGGETARALSYGRRCGRFLWSSGRRAALAAPLPVAPRWRSWRRLGRAAALAAA